jgi:phenylacetate-CoA ligase
MPLIRYTIGDRGVLSPDETCACGRRGQILQKVSGRNVDTFKTSQRVLVDGEYFTHLMYFRPWVNKFQVVQKSPNLIQFKVVKTGAGAKPDELDEITDKVKVLMGADCNVAFDFVDDIPPTASGKYRYTISEVPEETTA